MAPPRTIILDANVVDQINRGNQQAATTLQGMRRNGDTVYVSQQAYNELVTQPAIPRTATANREFLNDLNIRVAPPGPSGPRLDLHGNNQTRGGGAILSEADAQVAAQARALNAEVWSFDRAFRNNAGAVRGLGVRVAPESVDVPLANGPGAGAADYRVGRRLMSLPPIEIGLNGNVIRRGPAAGGGGSGGSYSVKPEDAKPPEAPGPNPRGLAIIGGITLAFEGLNFVLNIANDYVQKKRVEEELEKQRAMIAQARSSNRKMGVLLLFYYKHTDAGESIIRPGQVFDYLVWGKGTTSDEAKRDALSTPSLVSGLGKHETRAPQEVWLPPLEQTEFTEAKAPLPPVALARFFLGNGTKAKFQLVKFNVFEGFDDIVESSVDLPADTNVDFVILKPPAEVRWYNINGRQTTSVPLKDAKTANGNTITVVDLDPYSPFHARAAMVFPVKQAGLEVFNRVRATEDTTNALGTYVNFRMVRWVRAENIHLLKFL